MYLNLSIRKNKLTRATRIFIGGWCSGHILFKTILTRNTRKARNTRKLYLRMLGVFYNKLTCHPGLDPGSPQLRQYEGIAGQLRVKHGGSVAYRNDENEIYYILESNLNV